MASRGMGGRQPQASLRCFAVGRARCGGPAPPHTSVTAKCTERPQDRPGAVGLAGQEHALQERTLKVGLSGSAQVKGGGKDILVTGNCKGRDPVVGKEWPRLSPETKPRGDRSLKSRFACLIFKSLSFIQSIFTGKRITCEAPDQEPNTSSNPPTWIILPGRWSSRPSVRGWTSLPWGRAIPALTSRELPGLHWDSWHSADGFAL